MNTTTPDDLTAMFEAFRAPLRDLTRPFALVARFEVRPTDDEQVAACFARAAPPTVAEPGCLAFELHRVPRRSGTFVVYEKWRSFADFEAHHRTPYTARLRAEINALLVGTPQFDVLEAAAT